jgi:2-octaprenyl-6-methoxyphenol hydroxylase
MGMTRMDAECAVVGGGPAGLTAAIALASSGMETALIAKSVNLADPRTTALLHGSVNALGTLEVWERCRQDAAPLRAIRIVDDTGRLLRGPETRFEAGEIGLEAFGYNIQNRFLLRALEERARAISSLTWIADEAVGLEIADHGATVQLKNGGSLICRLVIAADGRRSICRGAAGIETDCHSYPQTALTFNLSHGRPHRDTSTEFHTHTGPFTLVPLPDNRSSLVFVTHPDEAPSLAALSPLALAEEIERRSHSILGKVQVEPNRGMFPLTVETAERFGAHRIALIGEAAHTLPPIGAQGLNLGLRDAATIAELVAIAHREGDDVGTSQLTGRYDYMRRADIMSRTLAVDLLNRSLLLDFLPLQGARALGLLSMQRMGPLRRAAMREGIMPLVSQPRLMRGEAP